MYVLSEQGLQLLDWSCLSIPRCPDNIVAEVLGADLSYGCMKDTSIGASPTICPTPIGPHSRRHPAPAQSLTLPNSVPPTRSHCGY